MRIGLVLLAVLALAACGGGTSGDPGGAADTGVVAPEADAAPARGVELGGETLSGESLALAELRGKPVYVNVWASW